MHAQSSDRGTCVTEPNTTRNTPTHCRTRFKLSAMYMAPSAAGASALSQVRSKAWRFLATIPRCLSDAVAMHQHRPQNEATSAKFAASDAATTRKMQTLEDRLNKTGVTRTTSVALYRLQCLQRLLQRNPGLRRIFSSCLRTRQLTRACTAKFTQNTAPGPRNATDNSQTKESSL